MLVMGNMAHSSDHEKPSATTGIALNVGRCTEKDIGYYHKQTVDIIPGDTKIDFNILRTKAQTQL